MEQLKEIQRKRHEESVRQEKIQRIEESIAKRNLQVQESIERLETLFNVETPTAQRFKTLSRVPHLARKNIPTLQPCPNQRELEGVPTQYVFRITEKTTGQVVECQDVRLLMHLYSLYGAAYVSELIGGDQNLSRLLRRWKNVNPSKGVEDPVVGENAYTLLGAELYQGEEAVAGWLSDPQSMYKNYFLLGQYDYVTLHISFGENIVILPNHIYNTFLPKRKKSFQKGI